MGFGGHSGTAFGEKEPSKEIMLEKVKEKQRQYDNLKNLINSGEWSEVVGSQLNIALNLAQEELSKAKIDAGDEAEISLMKKIEENED